MQTWLNGEIGYDGKWSTRDKEEISLLLTNTNKELPSEISRAVRSLDDIVFWKGSEFRTVLMYVGMVVFKKHLPKDVYDHFLLLVFAVTICSTDEYRLFLPKVRDMFDEYIEARKELYGLHTISSNFHLLIHIIDDIERFGNLSRMSTYPFEDALGKIKSRLKLYNKPLQQIVRRLIELANTNIEMIKLNETFKPSVNYRFSPSNDPVQDVHVFVAFKDILIRRGVLISNRKFGNKWFLTSENEIFEMIYVFTKNEQYFIRGRQVIDKHDFFSYPLSSHYINIFESKLQFGIVKDLNIRAFKAKLICLSISPDAYVFMPLLHSFE